MPRTSVPCVSVLVRLTGSSSNLAISWGRREAWKATSLSQDIRGKGLPLDGFAVISDTSTVSRKSIFKPYCPENRMEAGLASLGPQERVGAVCLEQDRPKPPRWARTKHVLAVTSLEATRAPVECPPGGTSLLFLPLAYSPGIEARAGLP